MPWLPNLQTETAEEGFELAIKMSRMAVKLTQPDDEARNRMRPDYANSADSLIGVSQVVAINFQTVSQANNYWRS
ncbi:MAG: hexameric tyrosine-coordinated heme protein [Ruegeria sp.]|uniref:hexameric tyrosine-coordinated heme protein n=1 Tax=Ruegeria sp. TaxID=1879320 RepID=UPI00349E840E